MVLYSHIYKNFPQLIVIQTVKDFLVVKEAEVDVFLKFPFFLYDPTDVDKLTISLVPLLFLYPAYTSGSSQYMYC